jgi:hypothetical protein
MKILKEKLEEAQKNLESNAQMITWLNKQLNEKPGLCGSLLPPTTTSIANKYGGISSKPPTSAIVGSSFKPSFASIEQLNGGYVQ